MVKTNIKIMEKLNLIRLADVKEYLPMLEREEITMSRFAELLNISANKELNKHINKQI